MTFSFERHLGKVNKTSCFLFRIFYLIVPMKQNMIAPKYILLTTIDQTQRTKQPLKKKALPSKYQHPFDMHSPSVHRQKKSMDRNYSNRMLKTQAGPLLATMGKVVESVNKELYDCMGQLHQESRKNVVLKELIQEVGKEMQTIEETEKRLERLEVEQTLKMAQKVEYDIKQILQKHNEEVARINTLQEQVASARRERVVFSNLFRKLEKELKLNQQNYRAIIINTEINRQSKALKDLTQRDRQHSTIEQIDSRGHSHLPTQTAQNYHVFLTLPHEKPITTNNINNTNRNNKKRPNSSLPPAQSPSKRLQYLIDSIQTKTQKLAKASQCSNCEEALTFYGGLEEDNKILEELIAAEDNKIENAEAQLERLHQQRRISEVYQHGQINKLEHLTSTRKIRSIKTIKISPTNQHDREHDLQILAGIFDTLSCPRGKATELLVSDEEAIGAVWNKIQSIFTLPSIKKSVSRASHSQQNLQTLLGRMERFDCCDRILTRKQFCTEYSRQVSRNKRSARNKK